MESHWRGYLPHIEQKGATQFVTFRTADSLPTAVLEEAKQELRQLDRRAANRILTRRIERLLDQGYGECPFERDAAAEVVWNALLYFADDRYTMHACVVMQNHVHALLTPFDDYLLADIVRSWKSFTAKELNRQLRRTGRFWQPDYFDRVIRDESHFKRTVWYIHQNPVVGRLVDVPEDYRWSSARVLACLGDAYEGIR